MKILHKLICRAPLYRNGLDRIDFSPNISSNSIFLRDLCGAENMHIAVWLAAQDSYGQMVLCYGQTGLVCEQVVDKRDINI